MEEFEVFKRAVTVPPVVVIPPLVVFLVMFLLDYIARERYDFFIM